MSINPVEVAKHWSKEDKRLTCPFCAGNHVYFQDVPGVALGRHCCGTCGALGPLAKGHHNVIESRVLWNTRYEGEPKA